MHVVLMEDMRQNGCTVFNLNLDSTDSSSQSEDDEGADEEMWH